jgi:hypothetical protein
MDLLGDYGSSSDEDHIECYGKQQQARLKVCVNPSMQQVWSENFQKIKTFYEEKGHLTLPRTDPECSRLSNWLTYQRHVATSLRKDQLELLESVDYKTVPIHRDRDDIKWEVKYNQLKQIYEETDGDKMKFKERAMVAWISKQKQLLTLGKLDPSRQERLTKLGIDLSYACRRKFKSKKREEKWQSQFDNLKDYHRIKGDCNVPKCWKGGHSLGIWICAQQRQYAMTKTGEADLNPDRIQKLEQLGFVWSVNDASKRKNGRNRGSQN